MKQKKYTLVCGLMLAGLIARPAGAIVLRATPPPEPQSIEVVSYLSEINDPLNKALEIHNLMNEMPDFRDVIKVAAQTEAQKDVMIQMQKCMTQSNVKLLGTVFKNPEGAWERMQGVYEKQHQGSKEKMKSQDNGRVSFGQIQEENTREAMIARNILEDIKTSPEKWGTVKKGKSFSSEEISQIKEALDAGYKLNLAVDSFEKGSKGTSGIQKKMMKPFLSHVAELGIDTKDLDISNKAQYLSLQKQLKELKKKEMEEAYKYVELLEKQDQENPEIVAKRERLKAKKKARLSAEAQTATGGNSALQMAQMSPSAQQRLVLAALKKDENALVYLTQTNVMDIDQLIREKRSSNKVIAETHEQVDSNLEMIQKQMMPQILAECGL